MDQTIIPTQGSIGFDHSGGDRRLWTWYTPEVNLDNQQQMNDLARWACKTFHIFYSVFIKYE